MVRLLIRVVVVALLAVASGVPPARAASPPETDPVPVKVEQKGAVTVYRLPRPGFLPLGVAPDRGGGVWITFEKPEDPQRVGILDPDRETIAYLPAPVTPFLPRVAPDGALWITEYPAGGGKSTTPVFPARLARRDPAIGDWKVFVTPQKSYGTAMVAFDPAGNAWFSELDTGRVGRVDPRTGAVKEFTLPQGSLALGISVDKDGKVWTTGTAIGSEGGTAFGKVLRLDPDRGSADGFPLPRGYFATDLVADPQRGIWVTGLGRALVALIDPGSRDIQWWDTLTTETEQTTVRAKGMVLDGRGQVWVAEPEADQVSRIIPDKQTMIEYALPGQDLGIQWLAADQANNIWFAAPGEQAVGRIAADAPVWTLDPGWSAIGVPAGGQTRGRLRVTNEGKEIGRLALSALDAPEGITVAFQPTTIELGAGKSAEVRFTIKVAAEVREDRYPIRFVARGTGVAASRSAEVQVLPAGSRPEAGGGGTPVSLLAVGVGLAAGAALVTLLLRLKTARKPKK